MSNEYMPRVKTWVGATKQITVNVKDADGTARDLSSVTSATVSADLGGTAKIASLAATITGDGTAGVVTFTPDSADLDEAGDYVAQIRFLTGTDVDYTGKFILEVETPVHNV